MEGLTSVVNSLLLPMLVFTQILRGFNILNINSWIPVILIVLVQIGISILISFAISYATCSKDNVVKFLITSLSFTQTKTLQLLLVDNFTEAMDHISLISGIHFETSARNRALNYVLLSYLVENICRYTIGTMTLNATPDEDREVKYVELTDEDKNEPGEADGLRHTQNVPAFEIHEIFNVSVVAFVVAVLISFFIGLKDVILDPHNIVNETFFVSSDLIAKTVKVMTIFVFGSALPCYSWKECTLPSLTHMLQPFVKLVVFPLIALYLIHSLFFVALGWLTDPILVLMMVIHFSSPTGMGMLTLVGKTGYMEHDMGTSILIQHLVGIVTFTVVNATFLYTIANGYHQKVAVAP